MDLTRKNSHSKYLLLVDIGCIIFSFLAAIWIRYGEYAGIFIDIGIYGTSLAIIISLYIAVYFLNDTNNYEFFRRGFLEEMVAVLKVNVVLGVTVTTVMFILREGDTYSRIFFLLFFVTNTLTTYIARQYYKILLLAVYKNSTSSAKIMIITTQDQAKNLIRRIKKENNWEYQVTSLTILDADMIGEYIEGIEVKANALSMFDVAKREVLDGVLIHIPNDISCNSDLEEMIMEFQSMGTTVDLSIHTFGLKIHEKVVREMGGYHVVTFSNKLFKEEQLVMKRLVDLLGGLLGCLLTLLVTMVVAPAILIESPGPVFFSQVRIGRNGRRFKIYKFRSMYMDAEKRKQELLIKNEMSGLMFKLKDDPRVTKVGSFLRKTSLDEFPQFFNVLKGDMSLVGTRPPTEAEFVQYESRHKRRLALKAGITGLWQVSGRSDITDFEDVVRLDLEYIDNWSFVMDVKILFKTIGVVLLRKGSH